MPKRLRLTRRPNLAMTEDAYRRSFLFENFDSVMDADTLTHRLRLFNAELEARKQ